MTYDKEKYQAMVRAGVPRQVALGLSQDELPNIGGDPIYVEGELIEHLDESPSPVENNDKINEIIDRLNEVIAARSPS